MRDDIKKRKLIYGLMEMLFFTLIVFYIFYYHNPLKENFLTMNLHPLLVVVVAISLRYGNYIGIVSALIASVVYIYIYHQLGRDLYLLIIDFQYYKFLLMFFISAVIFGRFKDNYDFHLENAKIEYGNLLKEYEELKSAYDQLKFIKEELRKRIVGAEYSIVSLYEIASSLETLDSEEIYSETINLLKKFIKATAVSIYTIEERGKYLRLKLHTRQDYGVPSSIKVEDHHCFSSAIQSQKPVKVKASCENHERCPLLIGPIIKEDRVIAVVNIDDMEFEMVTDYSFHLFKVIIEWITKALAQALEVEKIRKNYIYYDETQIMRYESFSKRLAEEKTRKEKYDLEYGLLKYKVHNMEIKEIDQFLNQKVRRVDVLAFDEKEKVLYLLLPATKEENLKIVEKRIKQMVEDKMERVQ